VRFGLDGYGGAPLDAEITPVHRQLVQIGDEGLHERRLHVGVHRSLVGKRLDELENRLVIGVDCHNARPSQSFDIRAQLDHAPGEFGLLAWSCLEPDIDVDRHVIVLSIIAQAQRRSGAFRGGREHTAKPRSTSGTAPSIKFTRTASLLWFSDSLDRPGERGWIKEDGTLMLAVGAPVTSGFQTTFRPENFEQVPRAN